jgi:hypothetical protein
MKVLVAHGLNFGFRGAKEHAYHHADYFYEWTFGVGHKLAGLPFMCLANMPDKTLMLTMNNTTLHAGESSRIPIEDKPNSVGMVLCHYKNSLGPGHHRMYCKVANLVQKKHFEALGFPNALYSPNEPLGINTIMSMITEAGQMMGFNVCGHAFRRLFITSLVNEPGVSVEESLAVSCHNSVAAQRAYMTRGSSLEMAKFNALGLHGK